MTTLFSGHYLRNRSTSDRGVLGYSKTCQVGHLLMLATFPGTVGGQLKQVLLYIGIV
jgi:hypothetical protein